MIASTWINGSLSPEQQWQHVATFLRKQGGFTPLLETRSCNGVIEKRKAACFATCLPSVPGELTFYKARDGRTVVGSSNARGTTVYYLQPRE